MPETAVPIVIQHINLDIVPGKIPPIAYVSEYDTGRRIVISLLRDGHPLSKDTNLSIKVEGTIGKHGFSENATWANDGDDVVVNLEESMTSVKGRVWTKIKLINQSGQQISTCGFWLDVDRAGVEAETIIEAKGFHEQIKDAVESVMDEKGYFIDSSLSTSGSAADAKATGDTIRANAFTRSAKLTLMKAMQHVVWYDDNDMPEVFREMYDSIMVPSTFKRVKSIKSAGNSYFIAENISLPAEIEVRIRAQLDAAPSSIQDVFGATDGTNYCSFLSYESTNGYIGTWLGNNGSAFVNASNPYGRVIDSVSNYDGTNLSFNVRLDDASYGALSTQNHSAFTKVYGFYGGYNRTERSFKGLIERVEIMNSEKEYVACFIPVVRLSDNVAGLYEPQSGWFYWSAADPFIAGDDIV